MCVLLEVVAGDWCVKNVCVIRGGGWVRLVYDNLCTVGDHGWIILVCEELFLGVMAKIR